MNRMHFRKWTPRRVDREGHPVAGPLAKHPSALPGPKGGAPAEEDREAVAVPETQRRAAMFCQQVFVAELLRLAPAGGPDLLAAHSTPPLPELGSVIILETLADRDVPLHETLTIQALDWHWALAVELTHRQAAGERAVFFGSFLGARLRLG